MVITEGEARSAVLSYSARTLTDSQRSAACQHSAAVEPATTIERASAVKCAAAIERANGQPETRNADTKIRQVPQLARWGQCDRWKATAVQAKQICGDRKVKALCEISHNCCQ